MENFTLSQLCSKITSGGTPNTRRPEYYGGNIPWLKTQEVDFNRIYKTETFITEEGLNNCSAKWIPANSVIVAMYGATAGRIAINKIPLTTNQACCNLIIDPEKADYRYIYYNLLSRFDSIANMAIGGAQQNLNAGMIKELPIDLPDLPTQSAIAEILSSLDDKIELNNQINQNLEALAQALFKQWFVDFEFPNENGDPYKSSGGEMVDSELGEIPKGWKIAKLEQEVLISSSKRIFSKEYIQKGIPFFRGKEITQLDKSNNVSTELFISKERFEEIKSKFGIPKIGDILITSVGTIGNSYLVNKEFDFYFKDGNITWIKNYLRDLTPEYIFTWFRTKNTQKTIKEVCIGSTQQALTISALNELKIVSPEKEIIKSFGRVVKPIYQEIANNKDENQNLNILRDTLLPKLISGELEVKEAMEQIS